MSKLWSRELGWFKWLFGAEKVLEPLAWQVLSTNLRQWWRLSQVDRERLIVWTAKFAASKNWEGCQGLKLTDEMKVLVSGNAGLLVLGWHHEFYFPDVTSVLIYPDRFVAPQRTYIGSGVQLETNAPLEGQAWFRGPVIVNWLDVLHPDRGTPHNLVIHEFAHQLDMLNGGNADGIPPLDDGAAQAWSATLKDSLQLLTQRCETGDTSCVLDCYGCESLPELFAVSSEAYFEAPEELSQQFSELYRQLHRFYRPRI